MRGRIPWRLILLSVVVALVWSAVAFSLEPQAPWRDEFPRAEVRLFTVALVFAVLVPACLFRRLLARLEGFETVLAAVFGLLIGAACYAIAEVALVYLSGSGIEEVQDEPTWSGKLL